MKRDQIEVLRLLGDDLLTEHRPADILETIPIASGLLEVLTFRCLPHPCVEVGGDTLGVTTQEGGKTIDHPPIGVRVYLVDARTGALLDMKQKTRATLRLLSLEHGV